MAFVVLFSTLSFTINSHYCGDTLVDSALFKKAKTCLMETHKEDASSEMGMNMMDCCDDEQIHLEGQDELQLTFDDFSLDTSWFLVAYAYSYYHLLEDGGKEEVKVAEYPPPRIVSCIYQLDETYLI